MSEDPEEKYILLQSPVSAQTSDDRTVLVEASAPLEAPEGLGEKTEYIRLAISGTSKDLKLRDIDSLVKLVIQIPLKIFRLSPKHQEQSGTSKASPSVAVTQPESSRS